MTPFYLSLGSNLGDRMQNLKKGIDFLYASETSVKILRTSPFYETEPWGVSAAEEHPPYINVCVAGETNLDPLRLLLYCHSIEDAFGRDRVKSLAPRALDIDILFYDAITLDSPVLKIPHPRLHLRRFVIQPLADIAPDFIHPAFKKSINGLLKECQDKSKILLLKTI